MRLEQTSSGDVAHFEGERGAGRPTRYELPYGGVIHFGSMADETKRPMRETDADRVMRIYG